MAAFLGISVWVALATVIPGLITIAVLFGACLVVDPALLNQSAAGAPVMSDWGFPAIAIAVMILTQAFGILLEAQLVDRGWLGPASKEIDIPSGIDPCGMTRFSLEPYKEYRGVYLLLAELRETEDTQGHLQRQIAQFFLTNNSIVSFVAGILVTGLLLWHVYPDRTGSAVAYIVALLVFLLISFRVARIRFEVMAKALWAARRRRISEPGQASTSEVGQPAPSKSTV